MKKNKYSTPLWMLATILAGMLSPICTSFVQAHHQYFLAGAIDRPPVWPEVHLHVLLSHRLHCDHARQPVFPDIF